MAPFWHLRLRHAMPTLSIKNVPEPLVEKLRLRAARNHRSMQGELMALIASAVAEPGPGRPSPEPTPAQPVDQADLKSIEQIAAEHRARWPKPITRAPRAVDLIRAERDGR